MAGYRWNSSRERKKLRRNWRRRYVMQAAGRQKQALRQGLCVLLGAELLAGVRQAVPAHGGSVRLVRLEKEYCLEWQNPSGKDGSGEEIPDMVYGIRLDPEHLEVQFYQQKQLQ